MISPKSIEEVRHIAQVEEVLGEFIDLRRAGVNLKAPCPFHDEKTPSFVVSPAKGIYKCFGCGMAGDSIRFLMDHEKLSYPEAIRWLANKYNIELEETEVSEEQQQEFQKQESYYIINDFAQKQYHQYMMETREGKLIGLSYFKERGFIEKTVLKWGLGYAPDDRSFLLNKLQDSKYNLDFAHELGLLKNNRDFFAARIIFPIRNLSGKIIGIGARTLSQNKKIPKYLNSPESDIYNKRQTLFGLYFSKTAIRKQNNCLLVEGYTDVISLHQHGIEHVVASSGTSLTKEQVRLVKRFSNNITVLFDGDPAGIKAALRGLDIILEQDMNVRLLLLPEGEDPDSFVQKEGRAGFEKYVEEHSKDFILFKIDLLLAEAGNDPIKRSMVTKDIVQSIAKIEDTLKRTEYIKSCSRLLGIDEKTIQQAANKLIKEQIQKEKNRQKYNTAPSEKEWEEQDQVSKTAPKQEIASFDSDEHQERDIMRILMRLADKEFTVVDEEEDEQGNITELAHQYTVAEYLYENLEGVVELFDNVLYKEVLDDLNKKIETDETVNPAYYLSHPNEAFRQLAIDLNTDRYTYANWRARGIQLQTQNMPDDNQLRDADSALYRLKARKLTKLLQQREEEIIRLAENPSEELTIKIKAYQKIKQDLAMINEILRTVVL